MKLTAAQANALGQKLLLDAARDSLAAFHQLTHPCVSGHDFVKADHLRALAFALQRVATGEVRRLLIAVPPRHFKSSVASVALPAFVLGHHPAQRVVCASYGLDLSKEFASQTLQIMQSPIYQRIFPGTALSSKKPALDTLRTKHSGYRLATSVDGPLTGKGADLIIVDDPMKAGDAYSPIERERVWQWLTTSLITRFDKPSEGRMVVVMQRLHQQDLIGRLKADPTWTVLEFPAETSSPYRMQLGPKTFRDMQPGNLLFPQRFDAEALARLRFELGEDGYNAQMLQRPVPAGGVIFKLGKAKRFSIPASSTWPKTFERVLLSIDPAGSTSHKADYSAATWWGFKGENIYLLHAIRGQWDLPELLSRVRVWRPRVSGVLTESAGVGLSLWSVLRADDAQGVWNTNPKSHKEVRAKHANLLIDQGILRLPKQADWLDELEGELGAFPQGKNDDYVDSISQVAWNLEKLRACLGLPYIPIGKAA